MDPSIYDRTSEEPVFPELDLFSEELASFEQKDYSPTTASAPNTLLIEKATAQRFESLDACIAQTLKILDEKMNRSRTLLHEIEETTRRVYSQIAIETTTHQVEQWMKPDYTLNDLLEAQSGEMDSAYGIRKSETPTDLPAGPETPAPLRLVETYVEPKTPKTPKKPLFWGRFGRTAAAATVAGISLLTIGAAIHTKRVLAYNPPSTTDSAQLTTPADTSYDAFNPLNYTPNTPAFLEGKATNGVDLSQLRLSTIPEINLEDFDDSAKPKPPTKILPTPAQGLEHLTQNNTAPTSTRAAKLGKIRCTTRDEAETKTEWKTPAPTKHKKTDLPFYILGENGAPIQLRPTGSYGSRINPLTHLKQWHPARDYSVPLGHTFQWRTDFAPNTPFTISYIGEDPLNGNYLRATHETLRHETFTVTLCHLGNVLVKEGDPLTDGTKLAETDRTGRTWVNHKGNGTIHIEYKVTNSKGKANPVPQSTFQSRLERATATQQASLLAGTR